MIYDVETLSALLALCEGKPPAAGGFPFQKVTTMKLFNVFIAIILNKLLIWDALTFI